jgi:hypothetical protein
MEGLAFFLLVSLSAVERTVLDTSTKIFPQEIFLPNGMSNSQNFFGNEIVAPEFCRESGARAKMSARCQREHAPAFSSRCF